MILVCFNDIQDCWPINCFAQTDGERLWELWQKRCGYFGAYWSKRKGRQVNVGGTLRDDTGKRRYKLARIYRESSDIFIFELSS
jgi:hypothetical protein